MEHSDAASDAARQGEGPLVGCAGAALGTLLGTGLAIGLVWYYATHSDDDMAMWLMFFTAPIGAGLGSLFGAIIGARQGERHGLSRPGRRIAVATIVISLLLLVGGWGTYIWWSGWWQFFYALWKARATHPRL